MTVTPTEYVYTGGRQPGAIIGLIAYARFVKSNAELDSMAKDLAYDLMVAMSERSCTIMTPTESMYFENPYMKVPR